VIILCIFGWVVLASFYLVDAQLMSAPREWRGDPEVDDFECLVDGDHFFSKREHVGVVVFAAEPGGAQVPAQCASYAGHFVCDHGFSVSAAAEHDAAIEFAAATASAAGRMKSG
jgi:hypothetical protein